VAIIPLSDSQFNRCKSELKLIEAGVMGKAVICSDVLPYSNYLTAENSIKLNNPTSLYNAMRKLERNQIADMAEALSNDINTYFDFEAIQTKRKEIYEWLIQ